MSYILEALKKSEKDRQTSEVPDIYTVVQSAQPEVTDYPRLLVLGVIALLIANLLGIAIWGMLQSQEEAATTTEQRSVASLDQASSRTAARPFRPVASQSARPVADAPVSLEQGAAQTIEVGAVARLSEGAQSNATEAALADLLALGEPIAAESSIQTSQETLQDASQEALQPEPTAAPSNSLLSTIDDYTLDASEAAFAALSTSDRFQWTDLPMRSELSLNLEQLLPETFDLTSHLFSSEPAYRSIVLNGRFLKEAQYYDANIQVVEIVEQGVVLSVNDYYFRIFL